MQPTTVQIIRSAFTGDPTVDPQTRARLLALIRANGHESEPKPPGPPTEPRIIRRTEVGKRLSRSLRSVDLLAKTGVLHKLKFPGRTRAAGFLSSEIDRLLAEEVSHV